MLSALDVAGDSGVCSGRPPALPGLLGPPWSPEASLAQQPPSPAPAHWGPVDLSSTTCELPESRACLLHHLPPLPVSSAELTPRVKPGREGAHLQSCATQFPLSAHVQQQIQGCLRGHGCRLSSPWVRWSLSLRKGSKTGTQAPSPPASSPHQHEPCPCSRSPAELTWLIDDGGATQGVRTEQWGGLRGLERCSLWGDLWGGNMAKGDRGQLRFKCVPQAPPTCQMLHFTSIGWFDLYSLLIFTSSMLQ